MTRSPAHTVGSVLLGVALGLGGVGLAPPVARAVASCGDDNGGYIAPADIDGDCLSDVVVGVPTRSSSRGAVEVRFSNGATSVLTSATFGMPSAAGDRFGAAVGVWDLDGNGYADIVVGAPGSATGDGAIYIVLLGQDGPIAFRRVTPPADQDDGHFGSQVGYVRTSTGVQGLIVSAPGYDTPDGSGIGIVDAGAVYTVQLSSSGQVGQIHTYDQETLYTAKDAEVGDGFGTALSVGGSRVLVGTPKEDVGSIKDAGEVSLLSAYSVNGQVRLTPSRRFNQNTSGVPGSAEAYDRFGAAVALGGVSAVGVPGEDIGTASNTGMVQRFTIDEAGLHFMAGLDQNSTGVPGSNEDGDGWGSALATGYCGPTEPDFWPLIVGAPGENVGSIADAGSITVLSAEHVKGYVLTQGSGLPGKAEAGDKVGGSVSKLPGYDQYMFDAVCDGVVVGAPGEDVGTVSNAGTISVTREVLPKAATPWQSYGSLGGTTAGLAFGGVATAH